MLHQRWYQTSRMEPFVKIFNGLACKCFHKKLHLRCLRGFWIQFCACLLFLIKLPPSWCKYMVWYIWCKKIYIIKYNRLLRWLSEDLCNNTQHNNTCDQINKKQFKILDVSHVSFYRQKQAPEVFYKNRYSLKFYRIYRKPTVSESLFQIKLKAWSLQRY